MTVVCRSAQTFEVQSFNCFLGGWKRDTKEFFKWKRRGEKKPSKKINVDVELVKKKYRLLLKAALSAAKNPMGR